MPKMILTCGVSASGKSTYAEELKKQGWLEINRDNVRFDNFCNGVRDWSLYKFNKSNEAEVSFLCETAWAYATIVGANVIVSDTNLNPEYHKLWKERAEFAGYEFEVMYFDISLEEAWKRNERRPNPVRRDVITEQWPKWLTITDRKRYNPTNTDRLTKPHVILCDIDGTIAKKGNRSPFSWSKVGLDTPRTNIINLLAAATHDWNVKVIFLSGRDSICRSETLAWLYQHLPYSLVGSENCELIMRAEGDSRKDSIVKEEFFWEIVKKNYVKMVFDDRPQVVRMWKDLGLTVIDVSEGYQEF